MNEKDDAPKTPKPMDTCRDSFASTHILGSILKTPKPMGTSWARVYAPWMILVFVVFGVCEFLLWSWEGEASLYAAGGLIAASLLSFFRLGRVGGRQRCLITLAFLAMFVGLIILLLPAILTPREAARRMQCAGNLKNLGLSLQNFHSAKKRFPPAFVADEDGKPIRSWRMLILPCLVENSMYMNYDLREPWNSPKNQRLSDRWFDVFQCPSICDVPGQPKNRTDYVAVLGEDTFWRADGKSRKANECTKGLNNTIMLIEIYDSDILSIEPRDVKLDDFLSGKLSWSKTGVHGRGKCGFYEYLTGGRNVLYANGSVEFLRCDLTPDQLRRFFSVTEPFDWDKETRGQDIESAYSARRPIVFRHVVFYLWLATLLLQFIYTFFPAREIRVSQ